MRKAFQASFLIGALLVAQPALAQTPEPTPGVAAAADIDPVTIRAANRQRVLDYARDVSALRGDQISRRPLRLCPLVAGAPADVNTYVAARLRQVGQSVLIAFETKACRPNLLVLFSREPDLMLKQARARYKISFAGAQLPAIERFIADSRPVRWWHMVVPTSNLGPVATMGDAFGPEELRSSGSRIVSPTRNLIGASVVVIDARQVHGVEIAALADYVAMVSLADIDSSAVLPGQASILNLFADSAPAGKVARRMTPIDLAYLRALYSVRPDLKGFNQLSQMASLMAEELER
jgi:hypothetical protein